jgi:hypothetical protein
MQTAFVAIGGSVCLFVALIQSWIIVAHFSNPGGMAARIIPGGKDLVRSHIDYLMMAQFLFVFYGLFRLLSVAPPVWLVVLICFGSFFNPFAFFLRAMRPSYLEAPALPYSIMITVSCVATTVGYAAVAWILAHAALVAAGGV